MTGQVEVGTTCDECGQVFAIHCARDSRLIDNLWMFFARWSAHAVAVLSYSSCGEIVDVVMDGQSHPE